MQNITNLIPTGTVGAYTSNTVPGVAPTNNISFSTIPEAAFGNHN